MDEQMRDVKLSTDEICGLLDLLKIDHGDPDDFEPECPGCTAFQKLTAALSQPAAAWQPIESAPKDGTVFFAVGNDFGKPGNGRHYTPAMWDGRRFTNPPKSDEQETDFEYLTQWIAVSLPAAPKATP